MDTGKILYYMDGHEVTITDSAFKVKKSRYDLKTITRHDLSIISPHRTPFTLLMIVGSVIFICGAMNWIPAAWGEWVSILGTEMLVNSLIMTIGVILFFGGSLLWLMLKEKYAVHISTTEGEKDVIVSGSREYISHIVDALNRAFLDKTQQQKGT